MKFKIEQPELTNMLGAMATLVDEATMAIDGNGLSFRGMDPSHIALLDIQYPIAGVEGEARFGIRVGEALKMAKRFKGEIELSTTEDSMMQVRGEVTKTYKLRLIEASASSTPLPKLNFEVKGEIAHADLDKVLSDIQVVSEYVTIQDGGMFSGRGDSGEVSVIPKSESSGLGKATYSLDYLIKMVKAVKTDKPVVIEYGSKMPVRVSFEENRIQFYLAPRVSDD